MDDILSFDQVASDSLRENTLKNVEIWKEISSKLVVVDRSSLSVQSARSLLSSSYSNGKRSIGVKSG